MIEKIEKLIKKLPKEKRTKYKDRLDKKLEKLELKEQEEEKLLLLKEQSSMLKKQIRLLQDHIKATKDSKLSGTLKVEEQNKPKYPNKIRVTNLDEIEYPKISIPDFPETFKKKDFDKGIIRLREEIKKSRIEVPKTVRIKQDKDDPEDYLITRLSNGDKFIDKIVQVIGSGGQIRQPYTTSMSSGGKESRALVDINGIQQMNLRGGSIDATIIGGSIHVEASAELDDIISTGNTVINIGLSNHNTEYNIAIPNNIKRFTLQNRSDEDLRFAFEAGKVAAPANPFMTVKAGTNYFEDGLDLVGMTISLACGTSATMAELICWT